MSVPQDRMDQLLKRFSMMETQMASNPDSETYVKLASEYSELEPVSVQDPRFSCRPQRSG